MVSLLLFTDDLVLLACSAWVVLRLLDLLSDWCHHMGLTVSLSKTKWLVGGFSSAKHSNFADPGVGVTLHYRLSTLEYVLDFKHLGLKVTGSAGMGAMIDAHLAAAHKVWTWWHSGDGMTALHVFFCWMCMFTPPCSMGPPRGVLI